MQSLHVCGEEAEILEDFTNFSGMLKHNGGSDDEVFQQVGLVHAAMNSIQV